MHGQALPFFNDDVAEQRQQLETALRAVIACMPVETADDILDLSAAENTEVFADNLASADYGLYSQATPESKKCLNDNGFDLFTIHLIEQSQGLACKDGRIRIESTVTYLL